MAKSDYNVADRAGDFPVTALDRVEETVFVTPDTENAAAALAAGLKDAGHQNYVAALEAYESRDDIEALAVKQTRNAPDGFGAGAFMRELPNRSGGNGYAPDWSNPIVASGYDAAVDLDDDSDGSVDTVDTNDTDPRVQ